MSPGCRQDLLSENMPLLLTDMPLLLSCMTSRYVTACDEFYHAFLLLWYSVRAQLLEWGQPGNRAAGDNLGIGLLLMLRCPLFVDYSSCWLQVKRLLHQDGRPLHVHERLLAGSTAGVVAQTTIYPTEVGVSACVWIKWEERGGGEGRGRSEEGERRGEGGEQREEGGRKE